MGMVLSEHDSLYFSVHSEAYLAPCQEKRDLEPSQLGGTRRGALRKIQIYLGLQKLTGMLFRDAEISCLKQAVAEG